MQRPLDPSFTADFALFCAKALGHACAPANFGDITPWTSLEDVHTAMLHAQAKRTRVIELSVVKEKMPWKLIANDQTRRLSCKTRSGRISIELVEVIKSHQEMIFINFSAGSPMQHAGKTCLTLTWTREVGWKVTALELALVRTRMDRVQFLVPMNLWLRKNGMTTLVEALQQDAVFQSWSDVGQFANLLDGECRVHSEPESNLFKNIFPGAAEFIFSNEAKASTASAAR